MPTQNNDDKISLVIAGRSHSDWSSYRIDSDFLKAADGWQLQLGLPEKVFPVDIVRGAPVRLQVGDETVLSGRVDSVRRTVSRHGCTLSLTGRDDAAVLVDCAAPVFSANQLTLDEVIEKIVRPLGIQRIQIRAASAPRNDKVTIEPGMRAWDALAKAAAGRGLWPWFEPDGTLVVGGPDYTTTPVDTLILKLDGTGNNVMELDDTRSINGCFSELTVLAQSHARHADSKKQRVVVPLDIWRSDGSVRPLAEDDSAGADSGQTGINNMKVVVTDTSVPYYRPQILTQGDTSNLEQIHWRARKAISDARLTGLDITALVSGHRTASGVLWQPGQRVRIVSELHGTDGIFFLMGREFSGGRSGPTTRLRFKEDGVWLPDAFPREKHRRHRKKKEMIVVKVWEK
ncbi:phage baseplate assembly protein [Escherichia coli]|uniref:phage baseplate assembly protein n=1 Tax=Escherichia coli TaxID=562 RepID=UPI000CFDA1B7|nr:phage tail protein [Escherichia coli]